MADAQDSKSCEGNFMRVQVPPSAPNKTNPNQFNGADFFVIYIINSLFFTFNYSIIKHKREDFALSSLFFVLVGIYKG